ncbi:HAD family hydrolase [Streptomyces sp. NPDC002564]|uniref:HAD family hydrolase n=1 Tax=Streptomyces sp. NPDC002564 TaxID=3364649 RepID=UPI0036C59F6B
MTPDSTQSDATRGEQEQDAIASLREVIAPVRFVLFDFDGPICRLFARLKAEQVAQNQVRWLAERGLHGLLTSGEREAQDPYVVLQAVNRRHPDSDLVGELEERFTQDELEAARTAWPTPYADPLIRTWQAVGARLAITSNNSARAVSRYLDSRGLLGCFAPHLYGRTRDLQLLKPDPYCINRALRAMGADPQVTLMVGDAPSDCEAARRAGVQFLGYARNDSKESRLRGAGAEYVVSSLGAVLEILRDGRQRA